MHYCAVVQWSLSLSLVGHWRGTTGLAASLACSGTRAFAIRAAGTSSRVVTGVVVLSQGCEEALCCCLGRGERPPAAAWTLPPFGGSARQEPTTVMTLDRQMQGPADTGRALFGVFPPRQRREGISALTLGPPRRSGGTPGRCLFCHIPHDLGEAFPP